MPEEMTTGKLLSLKLTFWSILGALSVFFAEVVSCSDMFPFFSVWGILVTLPLYALHVLVLSHVVFTWGRPWFYALFAAGAVFGMYEALHKKNLIIFLDKRIFIEVQGRQSQVHVISANLGGTKRSVFDRSKGWKRTFLLT